MAMHPGGSWNGEGSKYVGGLLKPMRASTRGRDGFRHLSVPKRIEANFLPYQTVRQFLTHSTSFLFPFSFSLKVSKSNWGIKESYKFKPVLKF